MEDSSRQEGRLPVYIINDTAVNAQATALVKFGLRLLKAADMSRRMTEWEGWAKFDPNSSLLVFPGHGAKILQSYIPKKWMERWLTTQVFAKRYWTPGQPPVAMSGYIFPPYGRMVLRMSDIVVVDDVVSSGVTIQALKRRNEPWIPGARWHTVAWVSQQAADLRGFASSFSAIQVGERNRKVTVNSLSTFLSVPEIAENYARRNLDGQASEFLSFIAELRNSRR